MRLALFFKSRLFSKQAVPWLALLVLLALAALLFQTARKKSLVYDEVIYPAVGVLYWKTGDYRWNLIHPPLQKLISALPLLNQNMTIPPDLDPLKQDEWRVGYRLFFRSPAPAKKLIFLSRLPSIFLTLFLGFSVFWVVRRLFSPAAGLAALAAFAFDPLLLGNGALAMNDIFVTAFVFWTLAGFVLLGEKPLWRILVCGTGLGLAITSKLSGALLVPGLMGAYLMQPGGLSKRGLKKSFVEMAGIGFVAATVVSLVYGFQWDVFWRAIKTETGLHEKAGGEGFLLVPISGRSTWFYYPIAVLIKTPLSLLFLWIAALWHFKRNHKHAKAMKPLMLVVALFWVSVILSRNHFGVRYLLPASPLLAVLIGHMVERLRRKQDKVISWAAIGLLAAEALVVAPNHMAYFNQIIGGSKNGYKWLDGSNQDWGQDLPGLAAFLKRTKNPAVFLGYSGSNDPGAWDIHYQDVLSPAIASSFKTPFIYPVDTTTEFLVVSARLRADPNTRAAYAWLDSGKKPATMIGYTLFVYDISRDTGSVAQLAKLYTAMGRENYAKRQWRRALYIERGDRGPGVSLSLTSEPAPGS